jgi:hypothetical protein
LTPFLFWYHCLPYPIRLANHATTANSDGFECFTYSKKASTARYFYTHFEVLSIQTNLERVKPPTLYWVLFIYVPTHWLPRESHASMNYLVQSPHPPAVAPVPVKQNGFLGMAGDESREKRRRGPSCESVAHHNEYGKKKIKKRTAADLNLQLVTTRSS